MVTFLILLWIIILVREHRRLEYGYNARFFRFWDLWQCHRLFILFQIKNIRRLLLPRKKFLDMTSMWFPIFTFIFNLNIRDSLGW